MRLLTHYSLSLLSTWISTWLVRFLIGVRAPLGGGGEPLERLAAVHDRLLHEQRVGVEPLVVLAAPSARRWPRPT